jgi:aminoglycoside phosphotransferase
MSPCRAGGTRIVRGVVTGDAPHGEHDHSTTEPAIRDILASLGLPSSRLRWIESYSHSAWMTEDAVVRYRIIGPTGRLTHEAAVAACLPPAALYPTVIASGCWDRDDWLVTERIPGESMLAAWPRLSVTERERATHELARAVEALHGAPAQHLRPPCLFGGAPLVARAEFIDTLGGIAQRASAEPAMDARVARVLDKLELFRSAIDDDPDAMAHHDLDFGQCIWRAGHVVGLVDLEMSHANAADWDLPVLLGMCSDPRGAAPTVAADLDPEDFIDVPRWFRDAYPAPFAHPSLVPRLRVYELVYRMAALTNAPDIDRMLTVLEDGTRYERILPR